jgi:tetratricopeptide (TPR) repeat protein
VGDVLKAQGDLAGALASYKGSLAIRSRLTKADPANAGWQRDLSAAFERVGEVLKAQGDLAGALASYKDSLAIHDRLAKSDPANAGWQYDLALAYRRLAENGVDPKGNWTKVVAILYALDARGRLAPANKQQLAIATFKAGDYAKAVTIENELVDAAEKADIKTTGGPAAETARALGGLAWYELFARQFEGALAASVRALSLAPTEVWLATNRAHAFMFLGREEEARAAYLQHRGERPHKNDNKTWEEVVLEDFIEFEKRGLTHPQMAEIRSLLAAAR